MTYLVPTGRLSERERAAIRSVGGLMEQGAEDREDAELQRQANVEEDANSNWDPASGTESPSTQRILDAYNELREQRQRGADASDDYYLAETDADEALLAGQTDEAARMNKAIASVAQLMNAGVVRYGDGDEAEAVSLDDYEAYDRECLSDFPDDAKPVQAPAPAPVADDGDDGFDEDRGPYAGPRRASEPPSFNPYG